MRHVSVRFVLLTVVAPPTQAGRAYTWIGEAAAETAAR